MKPEEVREKKIISNAFQRFDIEYKLLEAKLWADYYEVLKGDIEHIICDCGHSNELTQPFWKVICEKCGINIGEIAGKRTEKVFNRFFRETGAYIDKMPISDSEKNLLKKGIINIWAKRDYKNWRKE